MIGYHEYGPNGKAPRYETSTGDTGTSVAYERCSIQVGVMTDKSIAARNADTRDRTIWIRHLSVYYLST